MSIESKNGICKGAWVSLLQFPQVSLWKFRFQTFLSTFWGRFIFINTRNLNHLCIHELKSSLGKTVIDYIFLTFLIELSLVLDTFALGNTKFSQFL